MSCVPNAVSIRLQHGRGANSGGFATALICAAVVVASSAQLWATSIGNTLVVAVSGDAAPNGNGTISGVGTPVLNDAGSVAFLVSLSGTNGATHQDQAIFRGDSHSIAEIVRTGQIASNGTGNISSVSTPAVNSVGQIAFRAILDSVAGRRALYRSDGQTLVEIAHAGQPTPDGDGVFSTLGAEPSLNDRGEMGFLGGLTGSMNAANDGMGVFRADSTMITQLARRGQLTPSGNGRFSDFNNLNEPALNNWGQMSFFADLTGTSGGQQDDSGMFRVDGTNVVEIVREGQIDAVNAPRLNNRGELAFQAFSSSTGIYRADAIQLTQLATEDAPAPDGNGVFETFNGPPALNDSGQTAFVADLKGTSGSPSDDRGIFRADGNTLIQVVREGGLAPGGTGRFVSSIDNPAINEAGQIAFRALVRNEDNTVQRGVFLFDEAHGLMQVARAGDALLGSTITELNFAPGDSSGHVRSGFNDLGPTRLAYRFTLLDGRQGIAVWSLVPEPGCATLLGLALIGFCVRQRRQHF